MCSSDLCGGLAGEHRVAVEAQLLRQFHFAVPVGALDQAHHEAALVALTFDGNVICDIHVTGEAFLTPAGAFTTLLQDAIEAETGRRAALTTGGGTSHARFIHKYGPVAEFGLVGASMHQIDECVPIADIETLTRIYTRLLACYFTDTPAC